MGYAQAMKALPFHIIGRSARRDRPTTCAAPRNGCARSIPRPKPGTRPFLMVLDFVQIASGLSRDETREIMVRTAHEAHQAAKDFGCVVLLVSTTLRATRADGDETIGIHRDRRRPSSSAGATPPGS